jgi:hypothetical protein
LSAPTFVIVAQQRIAIRWHRDDDFVSANVDSGGMRMDGGQPIHVDLFRCAE